MEEISPPPGAVWGDHDGRMFNRWRDLFEQLQPLASLRIFEIDEAGDVATELRQAGDEAGAYGIGYEREYDRNIRRFALKRSGHWRGIERG